MIHPYQDKWPILGEGVFLAEGSHVIGDVTLGEGASIWFNTVVRGDVFPIRIGRKTNIQDNCTIHVTGGVHAATIEDEVTVGHRVILHGCTVEDECVIGMGSILLNRAVVGRGSFVAAGALVPEGMVIPAGSLVMGVPARVVRPVDAALSARIRATWMHYLEHSRRHRAGEFPVITGT